MNELMIVKMVKKLTGLFNLYIRHLEKCIMQITTDFYNVTFLRTGKSNRD